MASLDTIISRFELPTPSAFRWLHRLSCLAEWIRRRCNPGRVVAHGAARLHRRLAFGLLHQRQSAKVVKKISANQFTIRSSRGHLEVSWQVTGIRHDAWAEKNRIPNSVDKTGIEKGTYLHPEAFKKPESDGIPATPAAHDAGLDLHR